MNFAFSEEQELLRASARDYLRDRFTPERIVQLAESDAGWDPATWKELADMGWLDPSLGLLEHAVIAEETGTALLPAPWFSTVASAWPLLDDDGAVWDGYWQYQQLRSRGNTIEAGTSEVLRNIIAERVVGLPRSR